MIKIPVALQLYSVREALQEDFEGTLKKAKAMGYEGVEFAGIYGKDVVQIKKMTDDIGLVPISAHVPVGDMLSDPDGTMEVYEQIGCKFITVPWLDEERRPGGTLYDDTVSGIKMLADCAKKHGLTLLYHNHDFEFTKIDGSYALDILYDNVPALMTELDTCWIGVAGEDPAHYVEKYTDRAPIVHLKDYYMPGKKPSRMYELIGKDTEDETKDDIFEFRPLGYGVQDFPKIMAAAEKAGSKWCVIEQDNPSMGKTPLECARLSIDYYHEKL